MLIDLGIIALLVIGIRLFREPAGARVGNFLNIFAMCAAGAVVLFRHPMDHGALVLLVFLTGSVFGTFVAAKVTMIQIPAMVAFQHGAGGIAAFLVSFVELSRTGPELTSVSTASGIIGIIVGAATFSGSMVASGKLANRFSQKPVVLRSHSRILQIIAFFVIATSIAAWGSDLPYRPYFLALLIVLSATAGIVFSIRIGGADMPVLISFLNATAGFAAALCGIVIQNRLLIACGATVAASGSILTLVMCRAMNRSLWSIFLGTAATNTNKISISPSPPFESPTISVHDDRDTFTQAIDVLKSAKNIIVIPGYGMALAHAQFDVVALAGQLETMGKTVRFAIHPVAGRMPGHMNVLLAEADVDYEKLIVDLGVINPEFPQTDAVLIVGACDVVNPAAVTQQGTPISGMPILMAHDAKHIIVCNLDATPGYSGVENPLYTMSNATLLFGDAKTSIEKLRELLLGGEHVAPSFNAADQSA